MQDNKIFEICKKNRGIFIYDMLEFERYEYFKKYLNMSIKEKRLIVGYEPGSPIQGRRVALFFFPQKKSQNPAQRLREK